MTGLLLMFTYSPSATSAWASVFYIEQIPGGSFVRGLHYFGTQAFVIAFAVHLMRTLISGAFRAPRELIWITGVLLLPLVAAWSVTGNPLTATQKAFAQIQVESEIVGSAPVAGPALQRILIGGERIGNLTLTHLNVLHVAILPLVAALLLGVHLWQICLHGIGYQEVEPTERACAYFPHQTIRNLTVFAVVLGIISYLAWHSGAPLEAPAGAPDEAPPRPEWYFAFLFELRRYFPGDSEIIATQVLPGVAILVLLLIPAIDRLLPRAASFGLRILVLLIVVGGITGLTATSMYRDWNDAEFIAAREASHELAERARALAAHEGIPPAGPRQLLANDPKTQGPRLFAEHCATCHLYQGSEAPEIASEEPVAPNLYGFASREWIRGLLDPEKIGTADYFGNTEDMKAGDMVATVHDLFDDLDELEEDERQEINTWREDVVVALSAEADLPTQQEADEADAERIATGAEFIKTGDFGCTDCHKFHDEGDLGSAPDLTAYGSREWLAAMIADPEHERFYPDTNEGMPAFGLAQGNAAPILSEAELGLIVDWLRRDWYEPQQAATESRPPDTGDSATTVAP